MKTSGNIMNVTATSIIATLITITSAARADDTVEQANPTEMTLSAEVKPGERPPFYLNFLLSGSMLHEDSDNRLTSLDSNAMITPGLALRGGGVVKENHLIGGIFQANWRATRKVLDSRGGDDKLGEVANFYLGPEYRYQNKLGLYAGASFGFAYTLADNYMGDEGDEPDCDSFECLDDYMERSDDQGVPGIGVRAVVGWEYRIKRTLALNVEAFAGLFHGENEHNENMTTPTYGLALGIGI